MRGYGSVRELPKNALWKAFDADHYKKMVC